jgi:hypothetical protein
LTVSKGSAWFVIRVLRISHMAPSYTDAFHEVRMALNIFGIGESVSVLPHEMIHMFLETVCMLGLHKDSYEFQLELLSRKADDS